MNILFYFYASIVAAFIGSFINVLIDRIPQKLSFVKGRSYCMSCKRQIRAHENIPVLSYIFLLGKCAGCSAIIPFRIFVVEVLSAIGVPLVIFISLSHGLTIPEVALRVVVFFVFEWIFFTDLEYGIIPDQSILVLFLCALLFFVLDPRVIVPSLIAGIGACIFFALLFFGTRGRGMGFGDVKLSLALGLVLGHPGALVGLYGAFLTGSVISIILIVWGKKKFKKDSVPFGPFLVVSSLVALLYAQEIYSFVLRVLP